MKRHISGLNQAGGNGASLPDGVFLLRVVRALYCHHRQKPYFSLRFAVVKPQQFAGETLTGRLYCTPKALWKLNWFLRDFGYDAELISQDEVDSRELVDLEGIAKIAHTSINGRSFLNLEAFASAEKWEELSAPPSNGSNNSSNEGDQVHDV